MEPAQAMAFAHLLTQPSSLLLFLALPILYLFFCTKRMSSEAKLPPGPAQLPIIGNLHQLANGKSPHRTLWELSKRYGPLMHLKLGRVPALVVSSAAMAKEVLKTHDIDCCNRPSSIPGKTHSYGNSDLAFASYDDDGWKKRHRICKEEFFSNKKVASFTSMVEEEIDWTMNWIASRAKDSPVVDVSLSACFLFNSIVFRAAFGRSCRDGAGDMRIHDLLKESQAMQGGFFVGDFLPQFGWVDALTGMRRRLRNNFLELDSFYEKLIQENEELNHRRGNLLDALLHVQKDTKEMTENEIKGILMDILVAGTGTSWSVVEWAMTELMRRPEAMRKVQDEVRSCVGRKGKVEKCDLGQLRYLKAVIKETLRLHTPAPLLVPRASVRGFKLQGYDVAPKTTIFINAFAIGRDPASWERPEEFIPERFMVDQSSNGSSSSGIDLSSHHDFKLLTFGEGRRICPGMNLGLLMTELALANLLYCFDWSLPAGMAVEDIDMDEATGITVHKNTAVRLVAAKY